MPRAARTLAAAVTTVLALTSGALATVPAAAAPAAGTANAAVGAEEQTALSFPAKSEIVSAGPHGFLTKGEKYQELLWTRYADGSTTELTGTPLGNSRSDAVVVESARDVYRIHDMAGGGEPATIDLSGRGIPYRFLALSGSTLVMWSDDALHLVSSTGGRIVDRRVPGLSSYTIAEATPDTILVKRGSSDGKPEYSVVDVSTGTVTGTVTGTAAVQGQSDEVASSATTLATSRRAADGTRGLVLVDRASGAVTTKPLGTGDRVQVEMIGDWALTADPLGLTLAASPDLVPLTAHHVRDGRTVTLLDHRSSSVVAPDGTLLMRGGTKAHGEGLYRISLGSDGVPAAEPVASSGESAALGLLQSGVPEAITFGGPGGHDEVLTWQLSRHNVRFEVALRHTATGLTRRDTKTSYPQSGGLYYWWNGNLDGAAGPSGAYTWELTATPLNGIGEPVRTSGAFTVSHTGAPHDFNSDGSPDILARDAAGRLWRDDTYYADTKLKSARRTLLGGGWQVYDRIEATGDLAGSTVGDLLARDTAGALWFYRGKGDGGFTDRARIGTGWGIYDKITGGSDLTGDGRPDVLATDRSGGLWLYPATGNVNAPLADRKRIGSGWGVYNQITAAGNLAGTPAGDLVARDAAGVLWSYLGKGDGTLGPRTRIGGGWNKFTHLVASGPLHAGYYNTVLGIGPAGTVSYFATDTADWPLAYGRSEALYAGETAKFNDYS
ncbi:VCBS repeat-containing protein [Streptomyces sp. NPDC058583]|uniref:VCBS repeat-containing protein n=1 Tax=unclassified Streptomyces TaxID=2593676 RepID=UPI003668091D